MTTLELPYPPSVNHYWRHERGKHHISEEGRQYRTLVLMACRATPMQPGTLTGRLDVHVAVFPPDKRRRDLDNAGKALLDALAHAGVYEDDSQIDRLAFERGAVTKGGRVVVSIGEIT